MGVGRKRYTIEIEPLNKRMLVSLILKLLTYSEERGKIHVIRLEVEASDRGGIYAFTRWYPIKIYLKEGKTTD